MKKKIYAILILLAVMLWIVPRNIAQAESAENESMENMLYYTDAATGETRLICMETSNENADAERVSVGNMKTLTRAIIGEDNRREVDDVTVDPYSAIASLQVWYTDGTQVNTTGFMVSPRTMLTAAHCIVDQGRTVSRIEVFLKYNGTATTPTARASSWYICANYDESQEDCDFDDDYAIIRFSSDISSSWFGLHVPSNPSELLGDAYVSGYPGDIPKKSGKQFYAFGSIVSYGSFVVEHNIDAEGGQSGAPVYRYNSAEQQWQVSAIHVGSRKSLLLEKRNIGRRISSELFDWLAENGFITAAGGSSSY